MTGVNKLQLVDLSYGHGTAVMRLGVGRGAVDAFPATAGNSCVHGWVLATTLSSVLSKLGHCGPQP